MRLPLLMLLWKQVRHRLSAVHVVASTQRVQAIAVDADCISGCL